MKITKVRFQNLNSLTGTWCIDFTDSAYLDSSLFAITGPTGAGKSTLLDAICLALYGRTPRLGKITKSSNEIMSRHTGVCFAEVEFETMQGAFRCHWFHHRSRKKSSGDLQQPKHEIADSISGTIFENRMQNVLEKVEEVTGMDFDRFTRSTLLAQGGFAAFLQAKPDQRAPLLEQITGSKIYSQISMQVHEIYNLEKEKCTILEKDLNHIVVLDTSEEDLLTLTLHNAQKSFEQIKTTLATLREQQLWVTNLANLQTAIHNHKKQLNTLAQEYENKRQLLSTLPLALAAKELEPLFLEVERITTTLETNWQSSNTLQTKVHRLIPVMADIATKIVQHTTSLQEAEEVQKTGLQEIQKVIQLDHSVRFETKNVNTLKKELLTLEKEQKKVQKSISRLQKELHTTQQSTKRVTTFFTERANEEQLITEYLLIETKVERLLQLRKRQAKASCSISHREDKTKDRQHIEIITNLQTESVDVKKELDSLQGKLQLLIRIQSLENERKQLLEGTPCPLCGSTNHPYHNKQLVQISEDERLSHLIEIQETLHKRATEWKNNKKEQEELSAQLLISTTQLQHTEKQNKKILTTLEQKKKDHIQQEKIVQALLDKRQTLFGDKETAEQTNILENQVKKSRNLLEGYKQKHLQSDKEVTTAKSRLLQLEDEQKRQHHELHTRKKLYEKALHHSPFASSSAFLKAKLPHTEIDSLQHISKTLQKQQTELESLVQDKTQRFKLELAKKLTTEDKKTIESSLLENEKKLEEVQITIISTKEQLQQNSLQKQKLLQKQSTITIQKNLFRRWSRLHMLIGSADGKRFRNFAQGLTFELMVAHANYHLKKMNNRYILIRDTNEPLDLNVIDTYQAGEIRSTKNLSGGESFLISLALALGLSRMASNTIRVDSLFLDEGFGSLDEEALESALDTLAGLQEENKLIGVISHVGALKEKIPLQIEISRKTGGRSRMKGPGISRE
jgi:DNA repair protein SbcC/Rad50